jgi:hypothetical protein
MKNKKGGFTRQQALIVSTAGLIADEPASIEDAAFTARQFVQCTLPHSKPKGNTWSRRNGTFALGIQGGFDATTGEEIGLPYGVIPRLLLLWVTTEALRTKSRRLDLGATLAEFMRDVGLDPSRGGERSDARRLQEQMRRLFQARITFQQNIEDGTRHGAAWLNMEVASEAVLWWDVKNPKQGALWESSILLGEKLFEAITANPVPIDVRVVRCLTRSPLAMDLYNLLCYEAWRVQRTGKSRFIPYRALMTQLGAEYTGEDAEKDFSKKVRAALRKMLPLMGGVKVSTRGGGLTVLSGSVPPIPPDDRKRLR